MLPTVANATRDFHSTAVETPESHKICVKAFQRKTPPMMMTCDGCQSGPLGCGPSSAISRHSAFVLFHPYLFAICPVQSTIWRKYLGCKSFTVRSGCAACVDRRCSSQRGTPTCRRSIGRTEDTAGEPTAGAGGGDIQRAARGGHGRPERPFRPRGVCVNRTRAFYMTKAVIDAEDYVMHLMLRLCFLRRSRRANGVVATSSGSYDTDDVTASRMRRTQAVLERAIPAPSNPRRCTLRTMKSVGKPSEICRSVMRATTDCCC